MLFKFILWALAVLQAQAAQVQVKRSKDVMRAAVEIDELEEKIANARVEQSAAQRIENVLKGVTGS